MRLKASPEFNALKSPFVMALSAALDFPPSCDRSLLKNEDTRPGVGLYLVKAAKDERSELTTLETPRAKRRTPSTLGGAHAARTFSRSHLCT